jgi:hypothetical protein
MSRLLEPVTFRSGATSKNRIALAALTNAQSHEDGTLGDEELQWLERRARGGFGLVATCASHVAREGQGFAGELGIWGDQHLEGLTRLASALNAHGAMSVVQIFHGGARAIASPSGEQPFSASPSEGVRAATEADLARVIAQFADAAARAQRAGFGGVELHGAHGYLLTQFLSATGNVRSDAWGGALAGRARLIREVTRAVRARAPAPFVVGVRLSPEDFGNARGLDLDESAQVADWLAEDGVDFVHLSLWDAHQNTKKRPDQHALTVFRAALPPEVRLIVAGALWSRQEAEAMLDLGADLVALGRAGIANPDWALHVAEPAWQPTRPPLSPGALRERAVSDVFVQYLRKFKGFVEG